MNKILRNSEIHAKVSKLSLKFLLIIFVLLDFVLLGKIVLNYKPMLNERIFTKGLMLRLNYLGSGKSKLGIMSFSSSFELQSRKKHSRLIKTLLC